MARSLSDPGLDDAERKAVQDVLRHGLHVVKILPEGGTPGWAFSIGLWHNFGHPEVVVFGLDDSVAHGLLNEVARRVREGERFGDGTEAGDLLEGVRCVFRAMDPAWHRPFLGWMDWFYENEDTPVLQCVWPDHDGRWPWEAGFRPDWVWAQPLLFLRDPAAARATALLGTMGLWPPPASPHHPA